MNGENSSEHLVHKILNEISNIKSEKQLRELLSQAKTLANGNPELLQSIKEAEGKGKKLVGVGKYKKLKHKNSVISHARKNIDEMYDKIFNYAINSKLRLIFGDQNLLHQDSKSFITSLFSKDVAKSDVKLEKLADFCNSFVSVLEDSTRNCSALNESEKKDLCEISKKMGIKIHQEGSKLVFDDPISETIFQKLKSSASEISPRAQSLKETKSLETPEIIREKAKICAKNLRNILTQVQHNSLSKSKNFSISKSLEKRKQLSKGL